MDLKQLKKRLVLETGVIAGVCAVLGGVTYYLDTVSEDFVRQNRELEGKVNSIGAEINALHEKYSKVQQNSQLYQEAMRKKGENRLYINREQVRDKFNQFKDRYYLNNLRLSMQAIQEMADPLYKRKTNVMVSSEVSVTFDALSDIYVYQLMDAMAEELSGSCKIIKLSLSRNDSNLSAETLRSISQSGSASLVKGEVKFQWLGIKPVEASETNADAAKIR